MTKPGDPIGFGWTEPMGRQVKHLLSIYGDQYLEEKVLRQRFQERPFSDVLPLPQPLPVPLTHERVRPIVAAAYVPSPPVERKPKAERKAVRRRNRKKGQR